MVEWWLKCAISVRAEWRSGLLESDGKKETNSRKCGRLYRPTTVEINSPEIEAYSPMQYYNWLSEKFLINISCPISTYILIVFLKVYGIVLY